MDETRLNFFCIYRQGNYKYKRGTTAVLTKKVKKIDFDVTSETVQAVAMETS